MSAVNSTNPPGVARVPVGFLLGFALLGAPLAWMLQLIVNSSLAARACYPASVPLAVPIWVPMWWILIGVECSALLIGILALLRAMSEWRARHADTASDIVGLRRNRFLAKWALLISGLFTIAMIFSLIMLFILPVCNG